MLFNSFYTISDTECSSDSIKARLVINKDHPIFAGHFPGHPVVPGVCMMQMVREVMEIVTKKKLKIAGAGNMKFLSVINPEQNKEVDMLVTYSGEEGKYTLQASLFAGETVFFKLVKGLLQTT